MIRTLLTTCLVALLWGMPALAQDTNTMSSQDASQGADIAKTPEEEKAEREKAIAKAMKKKSKYPLAGSVGTTYSVNHANFVDTNGDFGTQLFGINGSVRYTAHPSLTLTTGVSARKSIVNDFFSRGAGTSTSEQPWEIGDVSIGASFGNVYTLPGNIGVTAATSLAVPLSRTSQAYGLIASGSANTNLGWRHQQFNVGLSLRATYNLTEEATIPVNCIRAPDVCRISGADTGLPVSLVNYSVGILGGYSFLDGTLNLSVSYGLASGFGAVEFEADSSTSPFAQTGVQYSRLSQSFGLTTSYRVLPKTNLALSMRTAGAFYTNDNKSWRFPLFDTESDLHARTSYTLSVNQSF